MSIVRIATQEDRSGMIDLLHMMYLENGVASLDEDKMLSILDRGLSRDRSVIGVVGDSNSIYGSIGLYCHQWWYSTDYHLEDTWAFVHPNHRKSTYAKDLLNFAKRMSDDLGLQLLIGILSSERTAAKVKLYEKTFGPMAGAGFVYPSPRQAVGG